jgi:hypothetical protein
VDWQRDVMDKKGTIPDLKQPTKQEMQKLLFNWKIALQGVLVSR